ncbi:unnamed protein product, partial [Tilletia laevis]
TMKVSSSVQTQEQQWAATS